MTIRIQKEKQVDETVFIKLMACECNDEETDIDAQDSDGDHIATLAKITVDGELELKNIDDMDRERLERAGFKFDGEYIRTKKE